jgi:hypothetical protein
MAVERERGTYGSREREARMAVEREARMAVERAVERGKIIALSTTLFQYLP